jgi:hypothetical protein
VAAPALVGDSRYSKIALARATRVRRLLPVQQLDLHPRPERLDGVVVERVAIGSHRSEQTRLLDDFGALAEAAYIVFAEATA